MAQRIVFVQRWQCTSTDSTTEQSTASTCSNLPGNFYSLSCIDLCLCSCLALCRVQLYDECTNKAGCCSSGLTCYQKDQYYSQCRTQCTPGISPYDPPQYQTPWSCQAQSAFSIPTAGCACNVTLFGGSSFGGWSTTFASGSFQNGAFLQAGATDNSANSLIVKGDATCSVTVYGNGDFSGWSATFGPGQYTANSMVLAGGQYSDISSLAVGCKRHATITWHVSCGH